MKYPGRFLKRLAGKALQPFTLGTAQELSRHQSCPCQENPVVTRKIVVFCPIGMPVAETVNVAFAPELRL
jgi:hypothetical protein